MGGKREEELRERVKKGVRGRGKYTMKTKERR